MKTYGDSSDRILSSYKSLSILTSLRGLWCNYFNSLCISLAEAPTCTCLKGLQAFLHPKFLVSDQGIIMGFVPPSLSSICVLRKLIEIHRQQNLSITCISYLSHLPKYYLTERVVLFLLVAYC